MRSLVIPLVVALLVLPAAEASAQAKMTYLVFKDGFIVKGKITRETELITDPATGAHFNIPKGGSFYTVHDGPRAIMFSPGQVNDAIKEEISSLGDLVQVLKPGLHIRGMGLPKSWQFIDAGNFDEKWERPLTLSSSAQPRVNYRQRITLLNPLLLRMDTVEIDWASLYDPRELAPTQIRQLLFAHYSKDAKLSPEQRRLNIYRFMLQVGWIDVAERELETILRDFEGSRKKNEGLMQAFKEVRATQWVEETERIAKLSQHQEVLGRLQQFRALGFDKLVDDKAALKMQDLKNRYALLGENLKEAERLLRAMPKQCPPERRDYFAGAADIILKELNFDTLPRLETFISQGQERERSIKSKRMPNPRAEEVMSFALTGWLLGDKAASKDVAEAYNLWSARTLVQDYLKSRDVNLRRQMVQSWKGLAVDEIARLFPMLPPPDANENLDTKTQKLTIRSPSAVVAGHYWVKLPPEYHHGRPWPVLMVLHNSLEDGQTTLLRWEKLAADNGYILVGPAYAGKGGGYTYSAKEHLIVLETLRDLRRRFQVDSDRVFLFGQEQGANAAWDIGLSHPEEFAGVLPMSGSPRFFAHKYWPNAQYLPFYVCNGELSIKNTADTRAIFKHWIRWNYPALLVEYKGRVNDWFTAEPERMMKWMNCKKRHNPMRELAGRGDEEFKTMRTTDNHFYWLSTDAVSPMVLNEAMQWNPMRVAGTLEAQITAGNIISVKTSGVGNVTVWLGPGMLNFGEKATFRVNRNVIFAGRLVSPSLEVLFEDQFNRSDRQRVYFARLDAKS